jgi:hypothetical protein
MNDQSFLWWSLPRPRTRAQLHSGADDELMDTDGTASRISSSSEYDHSAFNDFLLSDPVLRTVTTDEWMIAARLPWTFSSQCRTPVAA